MATKESYFPLAGAAQDGWSNDEEATATCFCGAVQLAFVGTHLINPIVSYEAIAMRCFQCSIRGDYRRRRCKDVAYRSNPC